MLILPYMFRHLVCYRQEYFAFGRKPVKVKRGISYPVTRQW